jgi:hypothetical protein
MHPERQKERKRERERERGGREGGRESNSAQLALPAKVQTFPNVTASESGERTRLCNMF